MDFENKKYKVFVNGETFEVHASRIIASWDNVADISAAKTYQFEKWLKTLGLNEEEICELSQFACNGDLELEASTTKFLHR